MKHSDIVSIDLGSAYTKVGIRRGWNAQAEVLRGLPIALGNDQDYCIPSVVAHVETSKTSRWLIGVDAASQMPGAGVRIWRNWKADLFRGAGMSAAELKRHREAADVAVAFLKELREVLLAKHKAEVGGLPVRIAVPKLPRAEHLDELMCGLLTKAGWEWASCRPTVFEPESNAIGFLSRGRNQTWTPPKQSFRPPPSRMIMMQKMLEPGLSTAFRTMSASYGVLVTDIGAFTTDFGFVEFDSGFWNDDWNRPLIVQQSVDLGIRQLDDAVMAVLEPEVQHYFGTRPAVEWERRKQEIYAGKPQRVMLGNKVVTIGADFEAEAIQDEIRRFASRVCDARKTFCAEHGLKAVHEEAITGGGSALATLRSTLLESIRVDKRRVHDLWDPNEPDSAVAAGAGRMTLREMELRVRTNRMLVRTASAVGGASVFFE